MSKLTLICDRRFKLHQNPESHPESQHRLAAFERALHSQKVIHDLDCRVPRMATSEELSSIHDESYIASLLEMSEKAKVSSSLIRPHIDTDTWVSPQSFETASLAAGAGLVAVEALANEDFNSSFVAIRPPGHHALANRAYGYCLFNNVAIAAKYAQQQLGLERILIVDWDVHHGNGTQDLFYEDPSVCFISFHQYPLWPADTGWYAEDGKGEGRGFNINIPLPAGTGDRGYLYAWDKILLPIAREYQPELILLSAGYDAHQYDPLGQQQVTTCGYYLLANRLAKLSCELKVKVACFLEGGYNTKTLAEAAVTTIQVLNANDDTACSELKIVGDRLGGDIQEKTADRSENLVDQRVEDLRKYFSHYWKSLRT